MDQKDVMQMIVENYPWEQVIYKIIALEALDPWDLDIVALSDAFVGYVAKLKILDFSIPARYVIICSVLLRLKTDHLEFIDFGGQEGGEMAEVEEGEETIQNSDGTLNLVSIDIPKKRMAQRKVVFEELVSALRKALATEERREGRQVVKRVELSIPKHDISKKINNLYNKIDELTRQIKREEVEFSKLVGKWNREEIVNTFLPLMHLDFDKKIECRQEKIFDEIFVKKIN